MELKIIELDDTCTHAGLVGRLDVIGALEMDNKLSDLIVGRKKNTVLDLSDVSFLGSVGIRLFVEIAKALGREGCKLILANPRPMVKEVLDASAIGTHIPIESDIEKALKKARAATTG